MHLVLLVAMLCAHVLSFGGLSRYSNRFMSKKLLCTARNWHYDKPITSSSNTIVKEFKNYAKRSRREGIVVLDGHRMVIDAIDIAKLVPRLVLVSEDAFNAPLGDDLLVVLRNDAFADSIRLVHGDLMKSLSDTKTPQGVLAVFERPDASSSSPLSFEDKSNVLILDAVSDPGNVGTLIRTAYGLGWGAVLAVDGADPFGPKAVRASMGTCLLMPVYQASLRNTAFREGDDEEGGDDDDEKNEKDTTVVNNSLMDSVLGTRHVFMAELDFESKPYFSVDMTAPCALVIGSEASGIRDSTRSVLGPGAQTVHVPLLRDFESLNAGMAGAIIMGEALRQRCQGEVG